MTQRSPIDTLPGLEIEGLGIGPLRLEDLIDRDVLRDVAATFERLSGVPVRIVSVTSGVLASSVSAPSLCGLVNETPGGMKACGETLGAALRLRPPNDEIREHPCFSGAVYRVIPVEYDRRLIGKVILGPYLPASIEHAPSSLLAVDERLDPQRVEQAFLAMQRMDVPSLDRLCSHLTSVLDVILFSGHKALLTSKMHLASMRESYRELSEKKEKLERAYEELKELDRLKSNFLATISHELRTPLTSIMGYSEMLAGGIGGSLNEQQLDFVQTIRTKSEQLLRMIMGLLDLSKLESGTLMVRRRDVSLKSVVDDVLSTLAPAADKRKIRLEAELPEDLPPVVGDPDRLQQIFLNLADNALKFTPSGGSIVLSAKAIEEANSSADEPGFALLAPLRQAVEVRVSDTGIGIPETEYAKIFDPFYQVDQSSTREYGGVGLGLSIVKRLVDAHGGSIRVEANTPRGIVFVVVLPATRDPESSGCAPAALQ